MERIKNLYALLRSETNSGYFKPFLSALLLRFTSNPIVGSQSYKQLPLVLRSKSGHKSCPVMMEGERKLVKSAYREDPSTTFIEVARKLRTEL